MNMKSSLNLLLLLIGSCLVKQSLADTKLTDLGDTVFYEHKYGFPVTIPVQYESDFFARHYDSAQENEVYFDYVLKGNGAYLYQQYHHQQDTESSHYDLTIHTNDENESGEYGGELVIDLDFEGGGETPIGAGIYTIILQINMMYMNVAGETLMHSKSYTMIVDYQGLGGETMTNINQGEHVNIFQTEYDGSDPTAFIAPITDTNSLPSDLMMVSMQLNQRAVNVFDDSEDNDNIILNVATSDTNYRLWLDDTSSIKISKDRLLVSENFIHVWPFKSVDANKKERDATNNLKIVLNSLPSDLYYLAAHKIEGQHEEDPENGNTRIWVKLVVNIKDDTTGKVGSKEFTSMVELAPPPATTGSSGDLPLWLFILVGCALIISSIFLFVVVAYKKKIFCWKPSIYLKEVNLKEKKMGKLPSSITTSNNISQSIRDVDETENDVTVTCYDVDHIHGDHHHNHGGQDFFDIDNSLRTTTSLRDSAITEVMEDIEERSCESLEILDVEDSEEMSCEGLEV